MSETEQRHDQQAELALLSACLYSKTARITARKIVVGADFYQPSHEAIWNAISRLDHLDRLVDTSTIAAMLTTNKIAIQALANVVVAGGVPDGAADYAGIIRSWSLRRRLEDTARGVLAEARNLEASPVGLAATIANRFIGIRDMGVDEEVAAVSVTELLAQADDEPEWLIPGLLERRDRFMLTGEEGLGKSHLLRQFAIHAAAGLNPFDFAARFEPLRTLIVDCENTWSQVRRKIRPALEWVKPMGSDPSDRIMVECSSRIDVTRDKDLSKLHQLVDATSPDLIVIGPLYRLTSKAIQTDDEAAPLLAALDTLRDRGCALLMEAHAGHAIGKQGLRDLRPRGSSALLGWPEFGFGMRSIGSEGYADFVQWRGPRETDRHWPDRLRRSDGFRWVPHTDLYGWNQGGQSA